MEKNHDSTLTPIDLAKIRITKTLKQAKIAVLWPIPIMFAAMFLFAYFADQWDEHKPPPTRKIMKTQEINSLNKPSTQHKLDGWLYIKEKMHNKLYRDPFLLSILLLFFYGQIRAFLHYKKIIKAAKKIKNVIDVLESNNDLTDATKLKNELLKIDFCDLRDTIIHWLTLGMKKSEIDFNYLMDSTNERRLKDTEEKLSTHIAINRITLKLGFLGTLIGLIMTFPPMKRAIQSLNDSGGELKFVKDIAKSIEGDQYAILTTLLATGLSIFIELLTIRKFEKIFNGLDIVNNYLDEWNLCYLQPVLREKYKVKLDSDELVNRQIEFNNQLLKIQATVDNQINSLKDYVLITNDKLDKVVSIQNKYEDKIGVLFEKTEAQITGMTNLQESLSNKIDRYQIQESKIMIIQDKIDKQIDILNNSVNSTALELDKAVKSNSVFSYNMNNALKTNDSHLHEVMKTQDTFEERLRLHYNLENQLVTVHNQINNQISQLNNYVKISNNHLENLMPMQTSIAERVKELHIYEKQYRNFLTTRSEINIPKHLEPKIL